MCGSCALEKGLLPTVSLGWKPCIPGSEYHCYPITTDSG